MGVIVPRAKMPNNCEECDLKALCEDYWKNIREAYTRPSWCSLDDIDSMYFCGVPMEEAIEVMRMYKNGELVHLADRKTEPMEYGYKKWDTPPPIQTEGINTTCVSVMASMLENHCDTCKHKDEEWDSEACDGCCENNDHYEPQKSTYNPTSVNNLWEKPTRPYVETMSCQECKHFHENAVMYLDQCEFCFKECKYEPKDNPQKREGE